MTTEDPNDLFEFERSDILYPQYEMPQQRVSISTIPAKIEFTSTPGPRVDPRAFMTSNISPIVVRSQWQAQPSYVGGHDDYEHELRAMVEPNDDVNLEARASRLLERVSMLEGQFGKTYDEKKPAPPSASTVAPIRRSIEDLTPQIKSPASPAVILVPEKPKDTTTERKPTSSVSTETMSTTLPKPAPPVSPMIDATTLASATTKDECIGDASVMLYDVCVGIHVDRANASTQTDNRPPVIVPIEPEQHEPVDSLSDITPEMSTDPVLRALFAQRRRLKNMLSELDSM